MKKILSYIIIIGLFLIAGMKSIAIDSRYKNNLLNVELSQTPDNRVSVLLVFEKPYTDPVKVIYKTDNEYNILLPETYHSITSVSTLNALNIRNANVKLVPYFNQDNSNGYTKITLQTTRPVIFNAHASYITTEIAQNDLIEKIEQDEEFKINPTTIALNSAKTNKKTTTKTQPKVASKQTVKTAKTVQKSATKPTTKPVANTQTKPQTIATKQIQQAKPAEEIKPIETIDTQKITQTKTTEIQHNTESTKVATTQTNTIKEPIKPTTNNIKNIMENNSNTPIGVLAGAVILLLLMLSKLSHKKEKAFNIPNLKHPEFEYEPQQQQEMPQEIKDMTWQEKYKFMKEKESNITQPNTEIINNNDIQHLDTEEFEHTIQINNSKEIEVIEPNEPNEPYETIEVLDEKAKEDTTTQYDPFGLNNPPINEGFEPATTKETEETIDIESLNDFSDIEPTIDVMYRHAPDKEEIEPLKIEETQKTKKHTSNPIEPTLINQAKISKNKGFYLIKYNNEIVLMGYINEQVFLLHTFKNQQQSFVQTRLTEKQKGADVYLVRSENYKSLIKVTNNNMQTLMKL